jgi:hypothetical protein
MHEIENLIVKWRASMPKSISKPSLEEIEDHLRETIAQLVAAGHSEAAAFELAVKQVGPGAEIATEFQNAHAETWWAVKLGYVIALLGTLGLFAVFLTIGFSSKPWNWLLASHVLTISAGYTGTFLAGGLGLCYVAQRCFGGFSPSRETIVAQQIVKFAAVAFVLTAIGVGLAMIWAKLAWGRFWGWDKKEVGGLGILIWLALFIFFGWMRLMPGRALMLLAIFGNIVVSVGWFGSNAAEVNRGAAVYYAVVICVTVSHLLAIAVGLAPAGWLRLKRAA